MHYAWLTDYVPIHPCILACTASNQKKKKTVYYMVHYLKEINLATVQVIKTL